MVFIFITIMGLIIGLGAVTVIDIHGFLGRKSPYWTEATIRTHKVTKPLIWLGIILVSIGMSMSHMSTQLNILLISILVINGCFLSFYISPWLLKKESEGKSQELLPRSMQTKIVGSFLISFICWWSLVYIFVQYILIK